VALRRFSRVSDESIGSGTAGDWSFSLPGPPAPGQLHVTAIAAALKRVTVAGQQRAIRDELLGMRWVGEPQPHGAAVGGLPEP
jgi:hypothetical protein